MSVLTAEQVQGLIRLGVPMAEDIDLRIDHLDAERAIARVPFHGKAGQAGRHAVRADHHGAGRCSHVCRCAGSLGAC